MPKLTAVCLTNAHSSFIENHVIPGEWVDEFFFVCLWEDTSVMPRLVRSIRDIDLILLYWKPGSDLMSVFES